MDRRAERTRDALKSSFARLLEKRAYDAISVTTICADASTGRSTFYEHYADKSALKRDAMKTVQLALKATSVAALRNDPLSFGIGLFEHAHDHRALCRATLKGRGAEIALRASSSTIVKLVTPRFADVRKNQRAALAQMVVAVYLAGLRWWLETESELTPMDMNALCRGMVDERLWAQR
jgi:AcrR family transcriptional regulator